MDSFTEPQILVPAVLVVGALTYFALRSLGKKAGSTLNRDKWQQYELIEKENVTHNTRRFRFKLDKPTTRFGLPCGKHIMVRVAGNKTEKPYTPTSSDDDLGFFELVIKIYQDGKLTPSLDKLNVGDSIEARGPLGMINYKEPGLFIQNPRNKKIPCKQINMVAGGTGITPMLQVVTEIVNHPEDNTRCSLIFGNVSIDDVLCQKELTDLQELAKKKGKEFNVYLTLDKAPENWKQGSGYVTQQMLEGQFYPASDDTVTVLCGPPVMVKILRNTMMEKMGHDKSRVLRF